MKWEKVPSSVEKLLRLESKSYEKSCLSRKLKPKHKYLYILGKDKRETMKLKNTFYEHNLNCSPEKNNNRLTGLSYPKQRGS